MMKIIRRLVRKWRIFCAGNRLMLHKNVSWKIGIRRRATPEDERSICTGRLDGEMPLVEAVLYLVVACASFRLICRLWYVLYSVCLIMRRAPKPVRR